MGSVYIIHKKKIGKFRKKLTSNPKVSEINGGDGIQHANETLNNIYYPKSIQDFGIGYLRRGRVHPTQKPVALLEYLVKTYTLEGETVLDFTMGSGSTGVACVNLNRDFIGIELDPDYFKIAQDRISEAQKKKEMELF